MSTSLPIDRLLHWAYRDELPKRIAADSSTLISHLVDLGTMVDSGRTDDPRFPLALGDPHPDALMLEYKVRSLPDVTMEWEHWCSAIMGELLPYARADDPLVRRMQFSPSALVTMHARMGTSPHWDLGRPELKRVLGRNGKPIVLGITAGGRYTEGAHCPLRLDPTGYDIACARAEYVIWHQALVELIAECWNLHEMVATGPTVAPLPWIADWPKPRILRDLSAPQLLINQRRKKQ